MKAKIFIQVRGGAITHITSNTDDVEIQILDWDNLEVDKNVNVHSYEPDLVLKDKKLFAEFVKNTLPPVPAFQVVDLLYRDGANYKTNFTAKITKEGAEAQGIEYPVSVDDELTMEMFGYANAKEFIKHWAPKIGGTYDEDHDHNLMDVVDIIKDDPNIEVDLTM